MDTEAEETLTIIAERAQLAEGIEGIRSILMTMYRFPSLKNKKLAQKTGIAIPTIAAARSELVKAGIIEKRNFLGEKGREWIRTRLNLIFDYDPLPEDFDSTIKELPEEFEYLNEIKDFLENRPAPKFSLDQSHADFPTIIKKTLYLLKKGDIEGRKIIFLGDDDLISLAVGLTQLGKEITVLDIDNRVLNFLSESVERLSIKNFNILSHDLREPCPEKIVNKYDVVMVDPPYTNEALRLFLKRARQVLKSNINVNGKNYPLVGKKCLLSFGSKPPEEMQKLQLSILDHGFIINEMIPDFNHYEGASIIGKFSHLYYLHSVINPSDKYNLSLSSHPIYTSEVKSQAYPQFLPVGFHFIGEMRFTSQDLILDNKKIHQIFLNSLISAGLRILDIYNHNYIPYGFSIIAILETSHATLHTWPEHGYISIDLFICDEFKKGLKALRLLKRSFKPKESEFFYMERGKGASIEYKALKIQN
ncbi:MAG: adenosylmethionine decarboxylase [Promethearchaeota archaeon]|nr:MAG: adenosylmethionine decarboxylase [Candidatus Lokiarchaeota archaeon]